MYPPIRKIDVVGGQTYRVGGAHDYWKSALLADEHSTNVSHFLAYLTDSKGGTVRMLFPRACTVVAFEREGGEALA